MDISNKRTSLIIMAAGIGSRFGQGIKQLAGLGPHGQIIMDYSVYDAVKAGFDRVVFVIRKDIERDFREVIGDRIAAQTDVAYAFQELDDLPDGYSVPDGRKKPWGTGQAVLACADLIDGPFCVINADDYYGPESFRLIHEWLASKYGGSDSACFQKETPSGNAHPERICMAGFILRNTLSDNGGVTRGICRMSDNRTLLGIDETRNIIRTGTGAAFRKEDGTLETVDPGSLVSMNMWGFMPDFMNVLEDGFASFLDECASNPSDMKKEYLLPDIVDRMLRHSEATVDVLATNEKWFGITYHEDVPDVRAKIASLVEQGVYPEHLGGL